jgi:hypothetical protein
VYFELVKIALVAQIILSKRNNIRNIKKKKKK